MRSFNTPHIISDRLLEQDSTLAVIFLIYLKSAERVSSIIDRHVHYGIGRPIKEGRTCVSRANAYCCLSPSWPCRASYSKRRRRILSLPSRWPKRRTLRPVPPIRHGLRLKRSRLLLPAGQTSRTAKPPRPSKRFIPATCSTCWSSTT